MVIHVFGKVIRSVEDILLTWLFKFIVGITALLYERHIQYDAAFTNQMFVDEPNVC